MANHKALLHRLMETIVDEWGGNEAETALSKVMETRGGRGQRANNTETRARQRVRPSAIELVERSEIHDEKREPLLMLADRFDRKEFLPSVADVREFIIMTGERPVTMKDRTEAFRVLLRYLSRLPVDRLQIIAQAASHAGPAQLGPISDAISAAGERLSRRVHGLEAR